MGLVIDLSASGGNTGSVVISQNVDTYNDLVAGTTVGEIAYVYNSQGTKWLPFNWGGNYYPQGFYVWDGVKWVSDRNAISKALSDLVGTTKSVTTTYSAIIGDDIYADASLGGFTITLPDATINDRTTIEITKIDDSNNKITIDSIAGLVAFETSITLDLQGESFRFISNGINWYLK